MRQVPGYALWLEHVGDARDLRTVLSTGILAVVDLALNEPPATVTRELAYCRFPLLDGSGNAPWLVRAAAKKLACRAPRSVSWLQGEGAPTRRHKGEVLAGGARRIDFLTFGGNSHVRGLAECRLSIRMAHDRHCTGLRTSQPRKGVLL
jgi:hypothetical protein